jgi:hypothetical protein
VYNTLMSGENAPASSPNTPSTWQFKPDDDAVSGVPASADIPGQPAEPARHAETATWSASEFIHHQKSVGWYGMLTLATAVLAAGVYLLTKDKISTSVIIIVAIVLGISAARAPRTLEYKLDEAGLTIGEKFYAYGQFRSFALVQEGAFSSIVFMPLKRFMPLLTIYYAPADEAKVVAVLSDHLPMETHQLDMVDQLMRRIRF